jgi:hypothetical protein
MRDKLAVVVAWTALAACTPDTAHTPIFLPPPYNALPPAPPGTPIEPGRPVGLNGRQQEAVVMGVLKWMKDPVSVQFRGIEGVRNSRSLITVCGEVNGRNTAGRQVGMEPFVGVLMGPGVDADFVLVGIGSSDRERTEVTSLCRASGIYGAEGGRQSRPGRPMRLNWL